MDIGQEIKSSFRKGSNLTKLMYINLAVFILVNLVVVFFFFFNAKDEATLLVRDWLMVPASVEKLITRPWTILTYMFLHLDFLHILFNLLWFYWFGRIFLNYFTQKQMVGVYLWGGLAGAFLYILTFNVFPVFSENLPASHALGASAAVMAIAVAISYYVPDYTLNLVFVGPVKIKYIILFFIITDVLTIPLSNAGGHIAHLGGAFFGYLFAARYRRGKDLTRGINRFIDGLVTWFRPGKRMKVSYGNKSSAKNAHVPKDDWEYNKRKKEEQKDIDRILDKIASSGYDSLSKKEKEILFRAGK